MSSNLSSSNRPSPRVSALVPVYNGAAYLAEAVESAMSQTMADLEVIIIDDGSTDDSGAIADRLAAADSDRVKVIHQANGGLVAARNAGLAVARGEYVALLDADDAWYPHHLAEALAVLDNHPDVGLVHAEYEVMDAQSVSQGTPPGRWVVPHKSAWEAIFLWQDHVMQVTAVFRRSLVDEVGPFDPRFNRLGCEDRDMWLRIAACRELVFLPGVHARYRVHGANMSKQRDRMHQARLQLIDKHSQQGQGRTLRSKALAALSASNGYHARNRGEFPEAIRWYRDAIRHYPWSPRIWRAAVGALVGRR